MQSWLRGYEKYDEDTLREWIQQTSIFRETLADMARGYLDALDKARSQDTNFDPRHDPQQVLKAEKIQEHLRAMAEPTKLYAGQLPGFPVVYRLELLLNVDPAGQPLSVVWDSNQPRDSSQYRVLRQTLAPRAALEMQYTLHAYEEQPLRALDKSRKLRWVGALAIFGTVAYLAWVYLVQRRRREEERQRSAAQQQIDQAEKLRLEEELRRKEIEQQQEETE